MQTSICELHNHERHMCTAFSYQLKIEEILTYMCHFMGKGEWPDIKTTVSYFEVCLAL